MKRREFIKNTGLGAGSMLTAGSIATILAACNKNNMMNGGDMNMGGQPVPVTEGNFSRLLPIPNTVTGNAVLTAQATIANINGSNISVAIIQGGQDFVQDYYVGNVDPYSIKAVFKNEVLDVHVPKKNKIEDHATIIDVKYEVQ